MKKRVLRMKLARKPEQRKRCKHCGCELPLAEFHKQAAVKKDGRRYVCKACRKELGI